MEFKGGCLKEFYYFFLSSPSIPMLRRCRRPLKPLCQSNLNFMWSSLREGERKFVKMVQVT